jgi:hypothetical protein
MVKSAHLSRLWINILFNIERNEARFKNTAFTWPIHSDMSEERLERLDVLLTVPL